MRGRYAALSLLALGAGVAGGITLERFYLAGPSEAGAEGPKVLYWVAPMDANFRKDSPGKSPMGMDLVPVFDGDAPDGDPSDVMLSPSEVNAIGVRTAVSRTEDIASVIETVGFVAYDEDATSHVHARIEGWVEDLRVRAVGDPVRSGQALFEVYGPRQERDAMDSVGDPVEYLRVTAPQSGVITALAASEGMYLQPGVRAMSITDLATVWVIADVFERDIGLLSEGMNAEARFDPLPGKVFKGKVDYIYPELDAKTRTLSVRLRFDNSAGTLRPNMFGRIRLEASDKRVAITVPSEAVIRTGRAERIVLRTGEGTFRPRLVTTGLRDAFGDGGRTEIVQGLTAGEEVVSSAQFLIDSESALSAGFTRMAPSEAVPASGKGVFVRYDAKRAVVTLNHDVIPSLDWPAMETEFAIIAGIDPDQVEAGEIVRFTVARGSDGLLALHSIGPDNGVDAVGTGIVNAVTPDGKLSLDHDPIPALSWPAMTMDLPAKGVDLDAVPLAVPVEFDLAAGEDGTFTIVGVRAVGAESMPKATGADAKPEAMPMEPPMEVMGTVNRIDQDKRTANITHGPIAEIGMPGMTMDFPMAKEVDAEGLPIGREIDLRISMDPESFAMTLVGHAAPKEPGQTAEPPMEVKGTINRIDAESRTANITHGPLTKIGMPGMTMDFPLSEDVDPSALPLGEEVGLRVSMDPTSFDLTLIGVEKSKPESDPPMRVQGTINRIDAGSGKANITHGPITEIGMPGMTMDFPLGDALDASALSVGEESTLLVTMDPSTFEMRLVGIEGVEQ